MPAALGYGSTRQWVEERLGGYVRLSIPERREAVRELTNEGLSTRKIADVVGVAQTTVVRDANGSAQPGRQATTEPHSEPSGSTVPEDTFEPDAAILTESPFLADEDAEAVLKEVEGDSRRITSLKHEWMKIQVRLAKAAGDGARFPLEALADHWDETDRLMATTCVDQLRATTHHWLEDAPVASDARAIGGCCVGRREGASVFGVAPFGARCPARKPDAPVACSPRSMNAQPRRQPREEVLCDVSVKILGPEVSAEELRSAMAARGLNIRRFAELAGVGLNTVQRLLAGDRIGIGLYSRLVSTLEATPILPEVRELAGRDPAAPPPDVIHAGAA